MRVRPHNKHSLFIVFYVVVYLLAFLSIMLAGEQAPQAPTKRDGIRAIFDEPTAPQVTVADLSPDDIKLVKEALREATVIVRDPDEPGERVVSATIEQREHQRRTAALLRQALALFGERAPQ